MLANFQNLLLWNQKADELETLYAASSTRIQPCLFKLCPWVDTDLFYGKVKFGVPYAFVWEKGKTMDFSDIIVVRDTKVGRCSQLNEYMNTYEYQRSRSFIDLGPNHLDSYF